jgi:hypothetical protein
MYFTQGHRKGKKNLLPTVRIGLETTLPSLKGHFETSVIRHILAQCSLPIQVVVLVIRSLDGKVSILFDKALCLLFECLRRGVCPPLNFEKCICEKKNLVRVTSNFVGKAPKKK